MTYSQFLEKMKRRDEVFYFYGNSVLFLFVNKMGVRVLCEWDDSDDEQFNSENAKCSFSFLIEDDFGYYFFLRQLDNEGVDINEIFTQEKK